MYPSTQNIVWLCRGAFLCQFTSAGGLLCEEHTTTNMSLSDLRRFFRMCRDNLLLSLPAEWERTSPPRSLLRHQPARLFWLVLQGDLIFVFFTHALTHTHTSASTHIHTPWTIVLSVVKWRRGRIVWLSSRPIAGGLVTRFIHVSPLMVNSFLKSLSP